MANSLTECCWNRERSSPLRETLSRTRGEVVRSRRDIFVFRRTGLLALGSCEPERKRKVAEELLPSDASFSEEFEREMYQPRLRSVENDPEDEKAEGRHQKKEVSASCSPGNLLSNSPDLPTPRLFYREGKRALYLHPAILCLLNLVPPQPRTSSSVPT